MAKEISEWGANLLMAHRPPCSPAIASWRGKFDSSNWPPNHPKSAKVPEQEGPFSPAEVRR